MEYYAHSTNEEDKRKWHLLKNHLYDTGNITSKFAAKFGAEEIGRITGLLHDLGKYSTSFQKRLEGEKIRVDHSTAGAVEVIKKYGPSLGKLLAYVISGHHCGLPDWGSDADEASLKARLKRKLFDCNSFFEEIELPPSQEIAFPYLNPMVGKGYSAHFFTRILYSCLVDGDFLDTERALNREKFSLRFKSYSIQPLLAKLEKFLNKLSLEAKDTRINNWRTKILANCREKAKFPAKFFTLTVPTGGGKTLSSLDFALRHALHFDKDRVIYVIPYTSIIEQNAAVFRGAIGEENVLEHHSNFAFPKEKMREVEGEFISTLQQKQILAAENWAMPIITTTNVQFFESLYAARSSRCRKLHNIVNSVVIIDEAQMIPTGFLKPCLSALVELVTNYNTTVVLCTATQPALGQLLPEKVRPIEIIDSPENLYEVFSRVQVKYIGNIEDDQLIERLKNHQQVLCIVNSKKHARLLFNQLNRADCESVFHLSTRMCPAHRTETLETIKYRLKENLPCQVVSTQLIEAGVDVDFPVVYRSMAGIDSVAQAAGRCNREGRLTSGDVFVFWPEEHGIPRGWLKRTASIGRIVLERHNSPIGLEAVKEYFSILYEVDTSELDKEEVLTEIREQEKLLNFPFRTIAEKFKLIDSHTNTVIIPWDECCKQILTKLEYSPHPSKYARSLQRYGVEVYENEFVEMQRYGALKFVANRFYVLQESVIKNHYKKEVGLEPFTESMFLNDTLVI